MYPASLTKIITALVVYDIYKPYKKIKVKHVVTQGQTMGLVPGEIITAENLLYGTLVFSGNDAAFALADEYGLKKFINLMNTKAKELNMKDTHFTNPAGFDNPNHYTTPFDLSIAARELLKNKYLASIVSIKEITVSDTEFKYFHRLTNINKLLGEIQVVGGLKTGHTEEAGDNLITLYKHNGLSFLIVILKSQDRFQDTRQAISWIQNNVYVVNPSKFIYPNNHYSLQEHKQ